VAGGEKGAEGEGKVMVASSSSVLGAGGVVFLGERRWDLVIFVLGVYIASFFLHVPDCKYVVGMHATSSVPARHFLIVHNSHVLIFHAPGATATSSHQHLAGRTCVKSYKQPGREENNFYHVYVRHASSLIHDPPDTLTPLAPPPSPLF
jgi:hypothetical protein